MGKEYRKIVPFGLHKKSVDLFLKKLQNLQEKELLELREQVKRAGRESEQLSEELKGLRSRQRQGRTKDLLEQALQKTEEAELNSLSDAPSGIPTLKLVSLPNKESHVQQLDPTQDTDTFVAVIKRIADVPDEIIFSVETEEDNSIFFSEEGNDEPVLEQDNSGLSGEVQETQETEELPAANIVRTLETKFTPKVIYPHIKRTSNGFWGDADHYLEEEFIQSDAGTASYAEMPRTNQFSKSTPNQALPVPIESSHKEEIAATIQSHEEAPSSFNEDYFQEPDNSDIGKIKQNYIVGKLAGDNLLDRQGRLIVAKEATITEEVIRRAQREGKLAELIVNMTIPGLGE